MDKWLGWYEYGGIPRVCLVDYLGETKFFWKIRWKKDLVGSTYTHLAYVEKLQSQVFDTPEEAIAYVEKEFGKFRDSEQRQLCDRELLIQRGKDKLRGKV